MRKLLESLLFIQLLFFILPTYVYGEGLPQPPSNDNTIINQHNNQGHVDRPARRGSDEDNDKPSTVSRPSQNNRPSNNVHRPVHSAHHLNYSRPAGHHVGHRPVRPHVVTTHSVVHYYRPKPQYIKTYYVEPTTVYTDNSYVEVSNITSSIDYDSTGKFGFGINVPLSINTSIGDIKNYAAGGVGLYIKFRPIRYFSLELQNNYLFGILQYSNFSSQNYAKTLFDLGARIHFLDYGNTDVYATLAGTVSVWSYISRYSYWRDERTYMSEHGIQYGGQIGAGVNYITGTFEVGIDLRYTVESIPNFIPEYWSKDSDNVIHGMLLTLNLGFSL